MKRLSFLSIMIISSSLLNGFDFGSAANMVTQMGGSSSVEETQSTSLTETIVSNLGVSTKQAEGGVGSILNYAKANLAAGDFSTLSGAIPGASSMMALAPSSGSSYASLVSAFGALGLKPQTIMQFVPVIAKYLTNSGSFSAASILTNLFH